MNIAVPSRFACLNVEDDDFKPVTRNIKKNDNKQGVKKQEKKKDNEVPKKNNNKQPTQQKKEKSKKKQSTQKQWEEWQVKDKELVNGHFEKDLQNALLLSKLEYEEQKKQLSSIKIVENDKKNDNKKKKNKVMSLDEFLSSKNTANIPPAELKPSKEDKFFENVQMAVEEEIEREKVSQKRKEREANIEEIITISQYQEKLDNERKKSENLEVELEKLKLEMVAVKSRNKTLCGILGHGEMKDKAGVLIELETLQTVRNELTEEVTKLHALLEQERSKVASLQLELQQQNKHKEKGKKQ